VVSPGEVIKEEELSLKKQKKNFLNQFEGGQKDGPPKPSGQLPMQTPKNELSAVNESNSSNDQDEVKSSNSGSNP